MKFTADPKHQEQAASSGFGLRSVDTDELVLVGMKLQFGRAHGDLILAEDSSVSRKHGFLFESNGRLFIQDEVGVAQASRIDGVPVIPGAATEVRPGAKLSIGSYTFKTEALPKQAPIKKAVAVESKSVPRPSAPVEKKKPKASKSPKVPASRGPMEIFGWGVVGLAALISFVMALSLPWAGASFTLCLTVFVGVALATAGPAYALRVLVTRVSFSDSSALGPRVALAVGGFIACLCVQASLLVAGEWAWDVTPRLKVATVEKICSKRIQTLTCHQAYFSCGGDCSRYYRPPFRAAILDALVANQRERDRLHRLNAPPAPQPPPVVASPGPAVVPVSPPPKARAPASLPPKTKASPPKKARSQKSKQKKR